MAMFITTTGERFTGHALAALIRKEGRLITGPYINVSTGERCTLAVIDDYQPDYPRLAARFWEIDPYPAYRAVHGTSYVSDNEAFLGTPEERAEYMAPRFEALDEGVTP